MGEWNEKKKFWAETFRIVIFATIAFIAGYLILDPSKYKMDYQAELSKERLSLRAKIVDDFLSKSSRFTGITYDAFLEKETASAKFKDLYEGSYCEDYRDLRNRISVYFGEPEVLNLIEDAKKKRIPCYITYSNGIQKNQNGSL